MKIKIVYLISELNTYGGMARVTIDVANRLVKYSDEYDISIISFNGNTDVVFDIEKKIHVHFLPIINFKLKKDFIKVALCLRKKFNKDFNGIFIVNDIGCVTPSYLGLLHCKKAKFICWTHTNFYNGKKYGFSGFGKWIVMKWFDRIISLTKEDYGYYKVIDTRGILRQIYNIKDDKIKKQKYDLFSKKIISCGRLDKVKGFDILLNVAEKVFACPHNKDWRWDIYGSGPEEEYLRQMIIEKGLENNVRLMGYCSDIYEKYSQYSIYVFTSRNEGCPMAMIEALSSGLPMISFDFKCGPRDLISNGVNGYIINCFDEESMAEKIDFLMKNSNIRANMSKNSDFNLREFEPDYVIHKWDHEFKSLFSRI